MVRTLVVATAALAALTAIQPAVAKITTNKISTNGTSLNGTSLNTLSGTPGRDRSMG